MVKKRKRHLRKSIKYSLILIVLVLGLLGVYKLFFSSSKWDTYTSANEDALSINNEYCLLSYPKGFKDGSALLNELCDKEKEEDQTVEHPVSIQGMEGNVTFDHVSFGYNPEKIIIHDFSCEAFFHGVFLALAREVNHPTDSKRSCAARVNLHRYLIGSTTNTLRLYLERRANIVHCLLEDSQSILTGLFSNDIESTVNNAFSDGLLAV